MRFVRRFRLSLLPFAAGCGVHLAVWAGASAAPPAASDHAAAGNSADVVWTTFTDPHGSTIELPKTLIPQAGAYPPASFRSADGQTSATFETVTESRPGFPGNDPAGDVDPTLQDCRVLPPAFRATNAHLSAFSCVAPAGSIVYEVARYSPYGSVILRIEYPAGQKAFWDQAVSRMSRSMRQQPRHEVTPYG